MAVNRLFLFFVIIIACVCVTCSLPDEYVLDNPYDPELEFEYDGDIDFSVQADSGLKLAGHVDVNDSGAQFAVATGDSVRHNGIVTLFDSGGTNPEHYSFQEEYNEYEIHGIAIDSQGNYIFSALHWRGIARIDLDDGSIDYYTLDDEYEIRALDVVDSRIYCEAWSGSLENSRILVLDDSGNIISEFNSPTFSGIDDIAVSENYIFLPSGNDNVVYILNRSSGEIYGTIYESANVFNVDTTEPFDLGDGGFRPFKVDVFSSLYVMGEEPIASDTTIMRFDDSTFTYIDTWGSGPGYTAPEDSSIAADPSNAEQVYSVEWLDGEVFFYNSGGVKTSISSVGPPAVGEMGELSSFSAGTEGEMFLTDDRLSKVIGYKDGSITQYGTPWYDGGWVNRPKAVADGGDYLLVACGPDIYHYNKGTAAETFLGSVLQDPQKIILLSSGDFLVTYHDFSLIELYDSSCTLIDTPEPFLASYPGAESIQLTMYTDEEGAEVVMAAFRSESGIYWGSLSSDFSTFEEMVNVSDLEKSQVDWDLYSWDPKDLFITSYGYIWLLLDEGALRFQPDGTYLGALGGFRTEGDAFRSEAYIAGEPVPWFTEADELEHAIQSGIGLYEDPVDKMVYVADSGSMQVKQYDY